MTEYILAQPTELQVFTINDSDGELADYLVLNKTGKRARSVGQDFTEYKFLEKETKPSALKCRYETDKAVTVVKESDHTITTAEAVVIHK